MPLLLLQPLQLLLKSLFKTHVISSFTRQHQQGRCFVYSRGFLLILTISLTSMNVSLSESLELNNGEYTNVHVKTLNSKFYSPMDVDSINNIPTGSDDNLLFAKSRHLRESVSELFHKMVRKRRELASRRDLNKEGFTDIEKDALLLLHNSLRSQVNPTATNMIELTWDNDIEVFAQEWASKCTGDHRSNRNLKSWVNMGENLYYRGGGSYNEKFATDFWWNSEVVHYTHDTNKCVSGEVCGHYITAAWAKSAKVGCGIKRCATLPGAGMDRPTYYFVCNYNARFLSDTRPYTQGTPCSNCPAEFPKCRYNLCVTQSMLDNCEGYNGTTEWIGLQRSTTVTDPSMDCQGFVTPSTPTDQSITTDTDNSNNKTKSGDREGSAHALTTPLLLVFFSIVLVIAVNSP